MKKIDLGHMTTILANLGVIAGIAFLAVELQQNNQLIDEQIVIARVSVYATHASSGVAARGSINEQPEIWARGVAGEELEDWERTIFENQVIALNDQAITSYTAENFLGHSVEANLALNDFAAFLYQNPGARAVWLAREQKLNGFRRTLTPGDAGVWSFWQERVSQSLSRLDAAGQ